MYIWTAAVPCLWEGLEARRTKSQMRSWRKHKPCSRLFAVVFDMPLEAQLSVLVAVMKKGMLQVMGCDSRLLCSTQFMAISVPATRPSAPRPEHGEPAKCLPLPTDTPGPPGTQSARYWARRQTVARRLHVDGCHRL